MTREDRLPVLRPDAADSAASWPRGAAMAFRSVPDGAVGTAYPVRVVRDEPELIALYLSPGARGRRRAGRRGGPRGRQLLPGGWSGAYEERVWTAHRVLILYRPGDAHSVWLFWPEGAGAALRYWYINLEAPWRRSPVGFDTRDHTLDLVVAPDLSSWAWKDEDELAWALAVGRFSAAETRAIRAEGERVLERVRRRAPPFGDGWEQWAPDPAWTVPELPPAWRVVKP